MSSKLLILISGNGSNLQAIIDAVARRQIDADVAAVISNNPDAYGLIRARQRGIKTEVINHKSFATRDEFDAALLRAMQAYQADLVILAGFMRILSRDIVTHFGGRLINIHPSLLPKYPGLHTHQRALDEGDSEHGCSVHFVTAELDGGPLIAQAKCPILPDDNVERLAQRVHQLEHRLYPAVIAAYASGRLRLHEGRSEIDGDPIAV